MPAKSSITTWDKFPTPTETLTWGGMQFTVTMSDTAESSIAGKQYMWVTFDAGKTWKCSNSGWAWYQANPGLPDKVMPEGCRATTSEIGGLPGA